MARITRRPLAEADILDIWDHIAEGSVEQADRWVDKLAEKFRLIASAHRRAGRRSSAASRGRLGAGSRKLIEVRVPPGLHSM